MERIAVVEVTCAVPDLYSSRIPSTNGQERGLVEDHDLWKVLWLR